MSTLPSPSSSGRIERAVITLALGFAAALSPSPARAEIQLPVPPLPAAVNAPTMWFTPADLPALRAKRTDALAQPFYSQTRSFVDARLSSNLGGLGDDTLSKLAKGAALLHQLGETPASGPRASYRDLAADALLAIGTRTASNIFGQGGNLETQYDCGRLQSMAEARDMLAGTGLAAVTLTAIDQRIANWCDAFLLDPFVQLRNNNLEIKPGAALVTAALALAHDARANGWLTTGCEMINSSFREMLSDAGYFREGAHYTNYMLNNLLPAAYHVRNRTGVDWFSSLRPLVETALALMQPHGRQVPYEDAVPLVFPWLHVAAGYPGDPLAEAAMWAWGQGDREVSNFGVQQLEAATSFLTAASHVPAIAPPEPATRFAKGDAHLHALRSGWQRDAILASMVTAKDYSNLTITASRHNVENPLDVTLTAHGEELLVTASGGPQVTQSSQRSYYLTPSSRCTVLVDNFAPFTADVAQMQSDARIASHPDAQFGGDLLDLGRTAVSPYGNASRVRRTIGLVGRSYVVVIDEVEASREVLVGLPWRGRGRRQVLAQGPSRAEATWSIDGANPKVALDVVTHADRALSLVAHGGFYAPRYGTEDAIEPVRVEARGVGVRAITVLGPRLQNHAPLSVNTQSSGGAGVVAVEVRTQAGSIDTIASGPRGSIVSTGPITSTDAALALVRREADGSLYGFAVAEGSAIDVVGERLLEASALTSAAVTYGSGGACVQVADEQGPVALTIRGLDGAQAYRASWNGAALSPNLVTALASGAVRAQLPGGGGTLRIETAAPGASGASVVGAGSTGGGSTGGGGAVGSSSSSGGGGCQAGTGGGAPLVVILAGAIAALLARRSWRRRARGWSVL